MTNRSDIVYVIPKPEIGGAEIQLIRLITHLNPKQFRVTVICLDGPGSLLSQFEACADEVIVFNRRGLFDVVTFGKLLGQIRRINPKTVHTTLYIANLFGGWAARIAGVPNVVVSQRGLGIDPQHSKLKRAVHALSNGFIGQFSDARIVNSQAISDRMAGYGWTDCKVIHNGILERHCPSEGKLEKLRLELGLSENSTILTTVSRIDPKKDLVMMLRAFRLVLDREPDTTLLIAGGGFPEYDRRLHEEATRLGIIDRVRFLGFRRDITNLIALCDISLLSSITEGLPNAILESMLLGKPVVATRVGGVPELIDHGIEGYLTESGNSSAFADYILELIREPVSRETMGIFGRTRALSEFSMNKTVQKTTAVYGVKNATAAAQDTVNSMPEADESRLKYRRLTSEWAKLA